MSYRTRQFICAGCGNTVAHNTAPTRKYCSHECYLSYKRNPGEIRLCEICNNSFTARVNQVKNGWGKYCSRRCYTKMPKSDEFKQKLSKAFTGDKHPNWKGGIMKGRKDRNLTIYKKWRYGVFKRDGFCCTWCNAHNYKGLGYGVQLEADHIKSWTTHPELRYEISNGRTLCKECHSKRTAEQHRKRVTRVC